MPKYHSSVSTFQYSWDQVAVALFQRYPNPYSKHVLSEDVISREIKNGKLHTKRLLTKTNPLPKWAEKWAGLEIQQILIVEESIVDPLNKSVTTYTRNAMTNKYLAVDEKCVYKPNPENVRHTICDRWAWIFSSFFGFGRAIQTFSVSRFKQNIAKNVKGFNFTLERLYNPDAIPQLGTREKFKEKAKVAAEMAKNKTKPLLRSNSQ